MATQSPHLFKRSDDGLTLDLIPKVFRVRGGYADAETVSPTGTWAKDFPLQIYLKTNTDGGSGVSAAYFKTENITVDQPNQQLVTIASRLTLNYDIFDAYGIQSHLTFPASMNTTDANAHLTALSAKVTFTGTPTISKGWVTAGLFIIEGTGTVTQMCHGVSIVEEAGSTGAQSLLHLNTDVGTTPYMSFAGADASGKSIYTHTAAGTQLGTIKILVNGVAKWLPFMQAE